MKKTKAVIKQNIFYSMLLIVFLLLTGDKSEANNFPFEKKDTSTVEGRWDMTIYMPGKTVPSWLEVRRSGFQTLVGEFVGSGGSARPISRINFENGKISFSLPPQ